MKKIICGIGIAIFLTGCSSLSSQYKRAEERYEKLLFSKITESEIKELKENYLSLLNEDKMLSQSEKEKINQRLQVLEDLQD